MKKLISLFLIIPLFISCNKDDEDSVTIVEKNPSGPIVGVISFYDEFGNEYSGSKVAKVSIEGTDKTVTTDSTGKFRFEDIPTGSLTLIFEKENFPTIKQHAPYVFTGGISPFYLNDYYSENNLSYSQASTTKVTSLSVEKNANISSYVYKGTIEPAGTLENPRTVTIFFSKSPDVSYNNYDYHSQYYNSGNSNITTIITSEFSSYTYSSSQFPKGTTVYAKAYGNSAQTGSYIDPETNKRVFPYLNIEGGSNTVSYVIE